MDLSPTRTITKMNSIKCSLPILSVFILFLLIFFAVYPLTFYLIQLLHAYPLLLFIYYLFIY